jgi:hypothetical protein
MNDSGGHSGHAGPSNATVTTAGMTAVQTATPMKHAHSRSAGMRRRSGSRKGNRR